MEREKLIRLVTAAQSGDGDAMNALFGEFYNDVYYFALKTVKDEDLAGDITQESFVEIINTIGDLKEPAAFVKWMKQITYHQCTRYFKKKKDVLVDEDEEGNTVFDIVAEERAEFIPDEALDQKDFRKTILAMLDELSEEQRAATLLYYYDELSVKQIAEIQGVSEGTVKSRLNYARKSIKNSVEDYEKKNNVKLHSFAFLPFMFWLLKAAAEESAGAAAAVAPGVAAGVSAATGAAISLGGTTAAAASGAAAAVTAGTTAVAGTGLVAKIAALPLAVKIISVLTAGAIVIGSVGIAVSNRQEDPTEPSASSTPPATSQTGSSAPTSPTGTQPLHNHTYEAQTIDPTCTEQGYTVYTCTCGDSYEANYIAALDHSWDEGTVTQAPTEETAGERVYQCLRCSQTRTETIPFLDHVHIYSQSVTDPTCTEQGYTTYRCACGDSDIGDYVGALGHDWDEGVVTQEPTEDAAGERVYQCSRCSQAWAETIPTLDHVHTYSYSVIDPTCTEQGFSVFSCKCGNAYIGDYVGARGHDWDEGTVSKEPTEEATGERVYHCQRCRDTKLETIPPLDHVHTYAQVITVPTCTEQGYTTYTCTCGDSYIGVYIAATGHAYSSEVIAPTTEAQGYTRYECSRCGHSYEDNFVDKLLTEPTSANGVVPEGCSYIMADGTVLAAGSPMPGAASVGDQLITLYYTYTCFMSSTTAQQGWKVQVLDDRLEAYPALLPSINGLPLLSLNKAFFGCHYLVEAPQIPDTVTNMHFAFCNCKKLTQAPDIPDSVTDLSHAFSGCKSLAQAPRLGNHVEDMSNAFNGCDNLVEAPEIPSSVWDLSCAFMGCDNLVKAPVIPEGVKDMNSTFNGCTSLMEVSTIPSTVTTMGYTFDGCINLVNTPLILNGIDKLSATFRGCTSLKVITNIPESVTLLSGTFSGCTALEDPPEIPERVTNMQGAFRNCTSLKRAPRIPERVTSLDSTFQGCTSLTQAPVIPQGVKNMNSTFQDCVNITVAPVIPETVQSMGSTFRGCTSLTTAPVIPARVTGMNYTFAGCIQLTGMIEVNGTPTFYDGCLINTVLPITLFGTCEKLAELAATATNGNVTVASTEEASDPEISTFYTNLTADIWKTGSVLDEKHYFFAGRN